MGKQALMRFLPLGTGSPGDGRVPGLTTLESPGKYGRRSGGAPSRNGHGLGVGSSDISSSSFLPPRRRGRRRASRSRVALLGLCLNGDRLLLLYLSPGNSQNSLPKTARGSVLAALALCLRSTYVVTSNKRSNIELPSASSHSTFLLIVSSVAQ